MSLGFRSESFRTANKEAGCCKGQLLPTGESRSEVAGLTLRVFADLQVHSPYSRATSKNMTLEGLARSASLKGLNVVGTGDFTHPDWRKEIRKDLQDSPD